jgi:hypothetical protein
MLQIFVILSILIEIAGLPTIVEWQKLDFNFPNQSERERAINASNFIPTKCVPLDVDVDFAGHRIFVTIPQFVQGVPITLGTVPHHPKGFEKPLSNPKIEPYPNYSWHSGNLGGNCDGITSVYRTMIDGCSRLWVLDTGRSWKGPVCSPQLLAFDLKTDELLLRYKIPNRFLAANSTLVTPVIKIWKYKIEITEPFFIFSWSIWRGKTVIE